MPRSSKVHEGYVKDNVLPYLESGVMSRPSVDTRSLTSLRLSRLHGETPAASRFSSCVASCKASNP